MPLELALGPVLAPVEVAAAGAAARCRRYTRDARLVRTPGKPAFDNRWWWRSSRPAGSRRAWPTAASTPRPTWPRWRRAACSSTTPTPWCRTAPRRLVALNCGIVPYLLMEVRESEPAGVPVRCLPELLREQGFQTLYFGAHVGGFERWRQLTQEPRLRRDADRRAARQRAASCRSTTSPGRTSCCSRRRASGWRGWRPAPALRLLPHQRRAPRLPPARARLHAALRRRTSATTAISTRCATRTASSSSSSRSTARRDCLERTLFVVVGDHGEAFGEHGRRSTTT